MIKIPQIPKRTRRVIVTKNDTYFWCFTSSEESFNLQDDCLVVGIHRYFLTLGKMLLAEGNLETGREAPTHYEHQTRGGCWGGCWHWWWCSSRGRTGQPCTPPAAACHGTAGTESEDALPGNISLTGGTAPACSTTTTWCRSLTWDGRKFSC